MGGGNGCGARNTTSTLSRALRAATNIVTSVPGLRVSRNQRAMWEAPIRSSSRISAVTSGLMLSTDTRSSGGSSCRGASRGSPARNFTSTLNSASRASTLPPAQPPTSTDGLDSPLHNGTCATQKTMATRAQRHSAFAAIRACDEATAVLRPDCRRRPRTGVGPNCRCRRSQPPSR